MAELARNVPHPTAAVAVPGPGERLSEEARKLRIAIAQAIQKRTPKNLARYNSKWAKGGEDAPHYPATHHHVQDFPLAPQAWLNYETNKVCLQLHPDPERGGNHRVVCTNCINEMSLGTFETHKPKCVKNPPAYLSDPRDDKPAAKNNPWLKQFRNEDTRSSWPSNSRVVVIARRGTEFFYFLHPQKKYYSAYCTACGWVGGLNNWQKHAVKHQTAVLGDKAGMDAEFVYFTPRIMDMPQDEPEEEEEEEVEEEVEEEGQDKNEGDGEEKKGGGKMGRQKRRKRWRRRRRRWRRGRRWTRQWREKGRGGWQWRLKRRWWRIGRMS